MAGDWLKIEKATPDKPEVWEMAEILNLEPDTVVGKLIRFWSWFDDHTENGNAPSVTKALLDRHVSVSGFSEAMIAVGWMLEGGGRVELPNFTDHNGVTAKRRCQNAKRTANHRSRTPQAENGNAPSVTQALAREETTTTTTLQHNTIVEMGSSWFPTADMNLLCQRADIPEDLVNDMTLTEFRLFWSTGLNQGLQLSTAEWDHRYLKNLIHTYERRKQAGLDI